MDIITIFNTGTIILNGLITGYKVYQYTKYLRPTKKAKKSKKNNDENVITENDIIIQ